MVVWMAASEPLPPDAEVVVDCAKDADEDERVEGALNLPRLFQCLSLRLSRPLLLF